MKFNMLPYNIMDGDNVKLLICEMCARCYSVKDLMQLPIYARLNLFRDMDCKDNYTAILIGAASVIGENIEIARADFNGDGIEDMLILRIVKIGETYSEDIKDNNLMFILEARPEIYTRYNEDDTLHFLNSKYGEYLFFDEKGDFRIIEGKWEPIKEDKSLGELTIGVNSLKWKNGEEVKFDSVIEGVKYGFVKYVVYRFIGNDMARVYELNWQLNESGDEKLQIIFYKPKKKEEFKNKKSPLKVEKIYEYSRKGVLNLKYKCKKCNREFCNTDAIIKQKCPYCGEEKLIEPISDPKTMAKKIAEKYIDL